MSAGTLVEKFTKTKIAAMMSKTRLFCFSSGKTTNETGEGLFFCWWRNVDQKNSNKTKQDQPTSRKTKQTQAKPNQIEPE